MTHYFNNAVAAIAALALTLGIMAYAIVPAEQVIMLGTVA